MRPSPIRRSQEVHASSPAAPLRARPRPPTSPSCHPTPRPADNYEATCSFTDVGNWLIPGRLMAGRYPFVEPGRCRSHEVGEAQLRELVQAGLTTFVCLQVRACAAQTCVACGRWVQAPLQEQGLPQLK